MKKIIKKLGRFFVTLTELDESNMRESVLLVDGSFILPNNFALITKGVMNRFRNAKLFILTFKERENFVRENFPDAEIITPSGFIKIKKYQLAMQLLFLLRKRFRFVILTSLDVSTTPIALVFAKSPVFLYNRWLEWYRIRFKSILGILLMERGADRNRRKRNYGIKDLLKSLGRILVVLCYIEDREIVTPILIEDNGYSELGYIIAAVRKAGQIFINPAINILTFPDRKRDFLNLFPRAEMVIIEDNAGSYALAKRMYQLRGRRFDYIVLTSLDISPILISLLFFKGKILLFNLWHQWWRLDFRRLGGYVKNILIFLFMVPVFAFLFFFASFILLRTRIRLIINSLSKKG